MLNKIKSGFWQLSLASLVYFEEIPAKQIDSTSKAPFLATQASPKPQAPFLINDTTFQKRTSSSPKEIAVSRPIEQEKATLPNSEDPIPTPTSENASDSFNKEVNPEPHNETTVSEPAKNNESVPKEESPETLPEKSEREEKLSEPLSRKSPEELKKDSREALLSLIAEEPVALPPANPIQTVQEEPIKEEYPSNSLEKKSPAQLKNDTRKALLSLIADEPIGLPSTNPTQAVQEEPIKEENSPDSLPPTAPTPTIQEEPIKEEYPSHSLEKKSPAELKNDTRKALLSLIAEEPVALPPDEIISTPQAEPILTPSYSAAPVESVVMPSSSARSSVEAPNPNPTILSAPSATSVERPVIRGGDTNILNTVTSTSEQVYEDTAACDDACEVNYLCDCFPCANLYIGHVEGDGLGYSDGYTTLGVALPLPAFCNSFQPFIDIRNHIFNNGDYGLNLGVGARFCDLCSNGTVGINVYYDYLHHDHHAYHQIGLGFELLDFEICCCCFDLRLNGYIPVGDQSHCSSKKVFKYPGGFEASCTRCRDSLGGFDAEIGTCLSSCCWAPCLPFDLYLAAGPYFYQTKHCGDDVYGGRVRLEATYCNFTFELSSTYDSVFDGGFQAGIFFSIPLGDCCCPCFTPVYRNEIIVLDHKRCVWESNF